MTVRPHSPKTKILCTASSLAFRIAAAGVMSRNLAEPELQAAHAAAGRIRDFVQRDGLSGASLNVFLCTGLNNPGHGDIGRVGPTASSSCSAGI